MRELPQVVHLSLGGDEYDIQVDGKRYHFEWHPYCGPVWITKQGEPRSKQPEAFLEAASLWAQQGKRMEDGLCRWDRVSEPEPILKHIRGKQFQVIGHHPAKPPVRGE